MLYPNMNNLAQIGKDTFKRTGERINTVWRLANEIGRSGGIVSIY
jgi:hypothetical protein